MRNSPSCGCCVPCEVFNSTTDPDPESQMSIIAGSWTYGEDGGGNPYWSLTASVGGIACILPTVADIPFVLSTTLRIQSTNNAVRLRIAAGAVDVNNYLFAELYLLPVLVGGGGPPQYDYVVDKFRLGSRASGSDTFWPGTPFASGDTSYYLPRQLDGFVYLTPKLCWDLVETLNGSVESEFGTDEFDRLGSPISKAHVTPLGTLSGVFIQESSTEIRFFDYHLRHGTSESTPDCEECEESCHGGIAAQEWIIELADEFPGTFDATDVMSPECIFDCSEILGSYNVPISNELVPSRPPVGDSWCGYTLKDIPAGNQCSASPYLVSIAGSVGPVTGGSRLSFTMWDIPDPTTTTGAEVVFIAEKDFDVPIEDVPLDEWFDFTVFPSYNSGNTCMATGTFQARGKRVS